MAEALAAEGMKMWHHVVLSAVRDLAPVAQADLGRGVQLDPKDLVGILNDLQAQDLVVARRIPATAARTPSPSRTRGHAC